MQSSTSYLFESVLPLDPLTANAIRKPLLQGELRVSYEVFA
jgi:hypothetical protein